MDSTERNLNIVLIDHAFHGRTKSSDFFIAILRDHFRVTTIAFDPNDYQTAFQAVSGVEWQLYDLCVIWQLDALAYLSLAAGVPTVIVPMYDGSSGSSDAHWALLHQASALNFSEQLHLKLQRVLTESRWVRFYPNPEDVAQVSDFSNLRVMFWERTPAELPVSVAYTVIGDQADSWWLHLAPDAGKATNPQRPPSGRLTTTGWFADRLDFLKALDQANVLVCPRLAEGIGMVMLEGLTRGMCVVASHYPVHSEYITDKETGLLFDPKAPARLDLAHAKAMGAAARQRAERGFDTWVAQRASIPDFLTRAAARPPAPYPPDVDPHSLMHAYFADRAGYDRMVDMLADRLPLAWCHPDRRTLGARLARRLGLRR